MVRVSELICRTVYWYLMKTTKKKIPEAKKILSFPTNELVPLKFLLKDKKNRKSSGKTPDLTTLSDTPHSSSVISHTALNRHRLPISGQDFRHWTPNSCTRIASGTRLKNGCTLVCFQCTLSATRGQPYK